MRKKPMLFGLVAFLLFGCLVLLKALSNPQLRELRLVDALTLVAVGMFAGVGITLVARLVRKD